MKPVAIAAVVLVFFAAGIGGGYFYLTQRPGRDAADPGSATEATPVDSGSVEHGKVIVIPENAILCSTHRVPEVICPFCSPSLVDERGHCGAHDVAEALCTRCTPTLIAAFKAEGDWCEEHGLPESQCLECNPPPGG